MIYSPQQISPLEKLGLIDISASRLSTFAQCPARYFYQYILLEPTKSGAPAKLGSTLHAVLEDFVGEKFDLLEMFKDMEVKREKYDPERDVTEEQMNLGRVMLSEFYAKHKDETFDLVGKEVPFSIVIGPALVNGYIDRVERYRDLIRIVDYKTGATEVAAKNAPVDPQLCIYALAMANRFPGETIHAELYYLRTGRIKGHTFTEQDLLEAEERLIQKVNDLIELNSYNYTDLHYRCSYCDFKSTVCGRYNYQSK